MASVLLPLGIRVAVEYDLNGKVVVNVYHVTTTDPITTVKLAQIAAVFRDWIIDHALPLLSADLGLALITAKDISVLNGSKVDLVISPPEPGEVIVDAVSNNVAVVASFKTQKTGRSYQGRVYHAGFDEGSVLHNYITASHAAAFVGAYLELADALNIANSDQVVASFITAGEPRVVGVATLVDAVAMKLRVDTQRRRLPEE